MYVPTTDEYDALHDLLDVLIESEASLPGGCRSYTAALLADYLFGVAA